jgi:ADP-dependent NAD(P)H-hydrate dehydratase / NAD(P)H-hydrate epimerase
MPHSPDQILSVAQMRAAEEGLIAAGISVDQLMQTAGRGAAEWVWRIAAHRAVTVLCGPGNNGGDGYVIAEALRERGGKVVVVAATEPKTDAARKARALYRGEVLPSDHLPKGDILVDCLFGSGLTRPLSADHIALLVRLAVSHSRRIAIDVPSGVGSDSGMLLNDGLPSFDLTVALGAWKFSHFLMPAASICGAVRQVPIGVTPVLGAAELLIRPRLSGPAADAHKYRRGLLAVIGGAMPGAALLSAQAAQGAGAGYVKVFAANDADGPPDLVIDSRPLSEALADARLNALLIGPGLGRDGFARERLAEALAANIPTVIDADALVLLGNDELARRTAPLIATPHEGELLALEHAFGLDGAGSKPERAAALARASQMIVVAKGPDTVIAAPDGRLTCAPRASSWLSVAGTGDVLAGAISSRLATGADPYAAACQGVWLHGAAARLAPAAFSATMLAASIRSAYAAACEPD